MSWKDMFKFGSRGIAIDLGTANTVVYLRGKGIVINEPSVVAMEMINGQRRVRAVGADAKLMMGKTPDNIKTIRKSHLTYKGGALREGRWPEVCAAMRAAIDC